MYYDSNDNEDEKKLGVNEHETDEDLEVETTHGALSATSEGETIHDLSCPSLGNDFRGVIDDGNFSKLGGDPITATAIVNKARPLGWQVDIRDFLNYPDLNELSPSIQRNSMSHKSIPSLPYAGPVQQSYAQGRLWFLDQLNLQSSWYIMPIAVRLRGPLDTAALNRAIDAIVLRHETLRTTFEEQDGLGVQVVHPSSPTKLKVFDMSNDKSEAYLQILDQEQTTPFDLRSEPGWRVSLLRLGEDDHILSIVMHHIISDGWSVDILRRELDQFYTAALRGEDPLSGIEALPIQYRDFSAWQRQEEQMKEHEKQLAYWVQQLKDSIPAEILADYPRPALLSGRADIVRLKIEGAVYESLQAFSRSRQMTPFAVLLAAFSITHYRLTGSEDAMIGRPIANRNRPELENLIGFFVNTQCIRITVSDEDTFESLVRQVWASTAEAHENQDVPFERVVSSLLPGSRDASKNPLVQLDFALHSQEGLGKLCLGDIDGQVLERSATTRTDIEFHLFQNSGYLNGSVIFSTDLFELATIQAMVDIFQEVLRRGLDQPQMPIATMPLTDGLERLNSMGLLDIEKTEYPRDSSIIDVFREQVAHYPEAIAVKDTNSQLTYSELEKQSNMLASWLRRREMRAETLVAVFAPRSCQTIVSFLGILKANLAYLPLDTNAPAARTETILLAAAGCSLVLVGDGLFPPELQVDGVEFSRISDTFGLHEHNDCVAETVGPSATSLAYVMFTSGSTGKPKGVMIEHRGVVRLVKESNFMEKLPQMLRIAHCANLAFDSSVWEIAMTILNGGQLVCVDTSTFLDVPVLESYLLRERIGVMTLTPASLKVFLSMAPRLISKLDALFVVGDRLDKHDAMAVRAKVDATLYNGYGPTENSICSVCYRFTEDELFTNGAPIGRAVSNSGAYIMDPLQQLVSMGVMGELVVTGDGVARGYIDPALDVGRFVEVEIDGELIRGYRTGDRARWRPTDGLIESFGRMDSQIKIRGHRVEPAEIEHVILGDLSVQDVAIVLRSLEDQESEIVGFVTTSSDETTTQEDVSNQVHGWRDHFESAMYECVDFIGEAAIGRDFQGWTSMYDGREIDKVEMQEWLDDTLTTLLDDKGAGNVLEIGTGTGMILFNLGAELRTYVGLEPSKSAAAFVNKAIASMPLLRATAQVYVGTATDVHQIDRFDPDVAVLNSVVQYFPSLEYLAEVIDSLIQLSGLKRIFFGDIRSYALNNEFLASRTIYSLGQTASKADFKRKMIEFEEREEELLVDPAFFVRLTSQFPDRVQHVEILPKQMKATNELSSFRYAAVVHLRHGREQVKLTHKIDDDAWIDFQSSQMNREALLHFLHSSSGSSPLAFVNIPNSKIIKERCILEPLYNIGEEGLRNTQAEAGWISAALTEAESFVSLSAWDLVQIGEQAGFSVELSWARQQSQHGSLDAIFHRLSHSPSNSRVMFNFPLEPISLSRRLANQPLRRLQARQIETQIAMRLKDLLPAYMLPSQIIVLAEMPLNANGKVDRKELQRKARIMPRMQRSADRVNPRNDVERCLCEEAAAVLGTDISIYDNFFELGGHSLMATKLTARLSRRLNTHISVKDVFDHPVIADLADTIQQGSMPHISIPSLPYAGPLQQSYAQGRLWFLDQLNLQSSWYIMPIAVRLRGPLDTAALNRAIDAIVLRHETLRTTFEEQDGLGVQVVHPSSPTKLKVFDMSNDKSEAYLQILDQEQTTPFDLRSEPGWRVSLLRLGEDDHILSIVMHHIISDGWSVDILRRELDQFYTAALRGEDPLSGIEALPIQYRDFSAWQRQEEQMKEHEKQLAYWVQQLKDSIPAEILADYPRPALLSGRADIVRLKIEGAVYESLQAFSRSRQMTPFAVLLAAFSITHYRLTGSEDAMIGRPIANRNRPELENLIGFFVNTQCIRITVSDEDTFESLVRQVWASTAEAHENQDVPFERVVSSLLPGSRDASKNPLVQLDFALHSQEGLGKLCLGDIDGQVLERSATTRTDIEFHLFQNSGYLNGSVIFSTDLFELATIQAMVDIFQEVLRRGLDQPQMPIATMPLTDGLERLNSMGLLDIEKTEYPRDSSIIDVFREQVATCPEAIAVKDASSQLTYDELDRKSDELAWWLRRRQICAEELVGVLAQRSCETIVSFLGILKANLAYLPLDVKIPTARLKAILSAIPGKRLVLLGSGLSVPNLELPNVEIVPMSSTLGQDEKDKHTDVAMQPSARSLAYVLFTSGSTGKPKGVMVKHRGIVRLVKQINLMAEVPERPSVAHVSNLAFDASTMEIYMAILNGGRIICVDLYTLLDTVLLKVLFVKERVCTAILSPVLLKQCLNEGSDALTNLDVLFVAGDRFDARDAKEAHLRFNGNVYNAYGPTENTVLSTVYKIHDNEHFTNGTPIGRAISNSGAYIMDTAQRIIPLGAIGELVLTGAGLARGYTEPMLDVDRFVNITIKGQSMRAYRTGDRARWRPKDGMIEFFGRMDSQIKIRGHRVELAEIEHALLDDKSIRDAAVVTNRPESGDLEIISFITSQNRDKHLQDESSNQVNGWTNHFEASLYTRISDIHESNIGSDFVGWTSMYDGSPIDKTEMREWLDNTLQTLLDGKAAGHVLEIGTGTGMVLFNLGGELQSYVGIEPSKSAAEFVSKAVVSIPELSDRVRIHVGTAADVHGIEELHPTVVVLNSVVQYFPSPEYLTEVIDTLSQIPGVERLFFGDIRSYAVNDQFAVSRAICLLGEKATKNDIRKKIAEIVGREEELLVDPAYFTGLASRYPERVSHVEVLPKRFQATNELSSYRYTAVVYLRGAGEKLPPIREIDTKAWIDFEASRLDRGALLHLLQELPNNSSLAVANIPNSRIALERQLLQSLFRAEADSRPSKGEEAWIPAARHEAERCVSLSSWDLTQIGEQEGFSVEISWARQKSLKGALDVVFHRYSSASGKSRVMFKFPVETQVESLHCLTNHPLHRLRNHQIETEIRKRLQTLLPTYMVPAQIILLDEMPLNANGKTDRQELSHRAQRLLSKQPANRVNDQKPLSETEQQICHIWADVLLLDASSIRADDNFFELGGDSLKVAKVASAVRKVGFELSVKDVFQHPRLSVIASKLHAFRVQSMPERDLEPFILLTDIAKQSILRHATLHVPWEQILDILPLSSFQRISLNRYARWPSQGLYQFFLDFDSNLEIPRLERSINHLLRQNWILRTVFIQVQGQYFQVVSRCSEYHVPILDTQERLEVTSSRFCGKEAEHGLKLGRPPVKFTLLKNASQGFRLIFCLSHAQYDGFTIPTILDTILDHYNGKESKVGPEFSVFLKHCQNHKEASLSYWRRVLEGREATKVIPLLEPSTCGNTQNSLPKTLSLEKLVELPALIKGITLATIVSSAWAFVLSRLSGNSDIIYGRVVHGRNAAIAGIEEVIGPCMNYVPIRITFRHNWTWHDLLLAVQQQQTDLGEADSLDPTDMEGRIEDGLQAFEFDSVVQHQGFSFLAESSQERPRVGFFTNPYYVVPSILKIYSYPSGDNMKLRVQTNSHVTTYPMLESLLKEIGDTIKNLLTNPDERIIMGSSL